MALPAFVLPFLINFGVNKAMGMSTGKALGLAGMQAMLPGAGTEGALSGGAGGGIGSLVAGGGQQTAKAFALEGGKALAAGMAEKKYGGASPFLAYGGLQALQGAAGIGQIGGPEAIQATGLEGAKGAIFGPQTGLVPPAKPTDLGTTSKTVADATKTITPATKKGLGTGEMLGLGLAGTTLLGTMGGDDVEKKPEMLNLNYPTVKDIVTRFEREPGKPLEIGETVEERIGTSYQPRFQAGGLAQFNNGALVNRLPSKTVNDENDHSVYRRASNFVVDESGNGNGDEDTMLAQLADGEFVTTANAVLGAGIMAGASPNDAKQMRDKGAKYFYEQQARFKRIFEMLKKANAS